MKANTKIWMALIVVYIVWGSTYLAIRVGLESFPPFLLAGLRFLISGAILYIWRRAAGDPLPARIEWRSALIMGLLLLVGGNGGVTWAEQHVPSGIASLVVCSAPLWMTLIDALRPGGSWPNRATGAGVLVGFIGIVLLVGPAVLSSGVDRLDPLGAVVLLLAAVLWAAGSVYGRGAKLPASPLMGTGIEMLAGGAVLLLLATGAGEWGRLNLAAASLRSWLGFGYLVFFGSLAGFTAYTWLLRNAPTPLAATYAYVNPLVAVALGALLLSEPLNGRIAIASAVILLSVWLINRGRKSIPAKKEPAADFGAATLVEADRE
jgi:drug/metabolite transporter (DMT)-like permease